MKRQLPVIPVSPLPPLYAAWMDQLLAGPLPHEEDATCDDCAMLSEDGEHHSSSEVFFNPQTKCCSYIPALPNYLVGRILSDDDPDFAKGRAKIMASWSDEEVLIIIRDNGPGFAAEVLEFAGPAFQGGAVFFTCGGSEAVESALKLARQYQVETGHPEKLTAELKWSGGRTGPRPVRPPVVCTTRQ